jgi:Transposase zinc-binding domain
MRACGLEVADIFRQLGPAYRREHADALSRGQLRVMSAIERCRTALGGHVEQCDACGHQRIAFNSCLMGSLPIRGVRMNAPTVREVRSAVLARISSP